MASNSEFYIFRDSRKRAPASELVAALRAALCSWPGEANPDRWNTLLLRAGELECGLVDAQAPAAICEQASHLTDLFAAEALAFCSSGDRSDRKRLIATALAILERITFGQSVSVSVPEGFAYYALHPLDFADLSTRLNLYSASVLVVGIRSIGTTLSAVVSARLREMGVAAERITVRPGGHPYDRNCGFEFAQQSAIARHVAENAEFLICDEGPGRSGSSLLSVAEALEQEGVAPSRIRILCSHQPDVVRLCGRDAARRWSRYPSFAVDRTTRLPVDAGLNVGGGAWRRKLLPVRDQWLGIWPQLERMAFEATDGGTWLTFEGHGHYGAAVAARNQALSDAGFGPEYLSHDAGFGRHVAAEGRAASREDLTPELLSHMAEYCAWRAREFRVSDTGESDLEKMARVNFEREFGVAPEGLVLPADRSTICDAHMMPYAWRQTADDGWLKLDAAIHGDDHFFPGPCDIAWDLAGIVVEWQLSASAREFLLSKYRQASGEDASSRMRPYELAYATFRMAWSRMAASSVGDAEEECRLMCDYRKYRALLQKTRGYQSDQGILTGAQIQRA